MLMMLTSAAMSNIPVSAACFTFISVLPYDSNVWD